MKRFFLIKAILLIFFFYESKQFWLKVYNTLNFLSWTDSYQILTFSLIRNQILNLHNNLQKVINKKGNNKVILHTFNKIITIKMHYMKFLRVNTQPVNTLYYFTKSKTDSPHQCSQLGLVIAFVNFLVWNKITYATWLNF